MEQMPEVTIVSDEAFRLDASNAVCLLIHAMRLLVRPDDQLTKAAIAKIYHCDVMQDYLGDNAQMLANTDLDTLLPEAYINHFDDLRPLPLYDLAERLYTIFGLESLTSQSAYVCAFYDHLVNFVNENAADITAFLTEWEDTLCAKTIQSDETNGIRIFSIHKSKGLEYEHVIVPFCDWQLEKQSGNILWCQPSEAPFDDLPIVPVDYSQKQMIGTIYEADYRHEHLQNTVDNLNLLYVAFTRARNSLFVIGRRKASGTRSLLIEQALPLVADALQETDPHADIILEGLDDDTLPLRLTYGSMPSSANSASDISHSSNNPFLQPYIPLPVAIRTFESKVSFRQSNRSRAFIEGDDEEAVRQQNYIQTGSVLHEIFSTIRTTADIPDALQRLQSEGVIYDGTLTPKCITNMLQKRLKNPRVADWFSDRWTLFNECSILSLKDGQVCQHRPDRVMTDGHQWIVVDFKFGSPKPEYQDQVRQYMKLLADMGHQNIRGYLWYVYSNSIEEVTLSSNRL
jgi:ATP-dependent exoDNAse (exonuclease V) beta subunit